MSNYTSPPRPGDPPIPDYFFAPGPPDKNGSTRGCNGCAFRYMHDIRCSRIPCQRHPDQVAFITKES